MTVYTKLLPNGGPISMDKMQIEFDSFAGSDYPSGVAAGTDGRFGNGYSSDYLGKYILFPDGQIGYVYYQGTTPGYYGPGGTEIKWSINGVTGLSTPAGFYHFYTPTSRPLTAYLRGNGLVPQGTEIEWPVPAVGSNIDMNQFRGVVKTFYFTIPVTWDDQTVTGAGTGNDFAESHLSAYGWNGWDRLYIVNQAVLWAGPATVYSAPVTLGLTALFGQCKGIKFINNNVIVGKGGDGGMGGGGSSTGSQGQNAGNAIIVGTTVGVEIINNGFIVGGGGGGGAGYHWVWNGYSRASPGSGGASGRLPAQGGQSQGNVWSERGIEAYDSTDADGDGYYETPGPRFNWGWGGRLSSPGGAGGAWGAAGEQGGGVDGAMDGTGQLGGLGGYAIKWIVTQGNVSLVNNGTIIGAVGYSST